MENHHLKLYFSCIKSKIQKAANSVTHILIWISVYIAVIHNWNVCHLLPASETKLVKINSSVSGRASVPLSTKLLLGKVIHSQLEEGLMDCANRPHLTVDDTAQAEATDSYLPAGEPFEEEMSDPDCYEEQDSFSWERAKFVVVTTPFNSCSSSLLSNS
jgi:hypothetical protein